MTSASIDGMSGSYNSNSTNQFSLVLSSKIYIDYAASVFASKAPLTVIADYGAAHGINSIQAMNMIIESLREHNKIEKNQPIFVVHNDLPTNDWLSVFQLLNGENMAMYHGVASGKSFYEQCLPDNSLSFGYSASSLHWLSSKPCNLKNHCCSAYISEDDPDRLAFAHQSYLDYTRFLQYRSRELIQGGVLILSIPSWDRSQSVEASSAMHIPLLYECAQAYLTPEELLDYTIPIHVRWYDDCINQALFDQFSLELVKEEHLVVTPPLMQQWREGKLTPEEFARQHTSIMRSWSNSSLQRTLVMNSESEKIIDLFWARYEQRVKEQPDAHYLQMRSTQLILRKK